MSQDIRHFFKRTPGKESQSSLKVSESKKTSKKRYVVDSDSDDEFQSPKNKKSKTSKDKPQPSPKRTKRASPKKKETHYSEISKSTLDSLFGKEPVKRSGEIKKQTTASKAVKRIADEFENNDEYAAAFLQVDELSDEEWIKEKSFSSGYSSLSCATQSQSSSSDFSPKCPLKPSDISSVSPTKSPAKPEPHLFKDSPLKATSNKCDLIESTKDEKSGNGEAADSIPNNSKQIKNNLSPVKVKKAQENERVKFTPVERKAPLISGLWVDKYKPTNIKQIIGQQGEKSNVNKLLRWLKNWYINQSGTKKLTKPSPWAKDDTGAYFKAALLSGPPGVGKTTTAHLVCKELDMDIVEFNASDTRSKKLLNQEVGELLSSKSLSPFFSGAGKEVTKEHVLLMDEVDGMAGNEDRGGVQELIQLIKTSKVPVICMCNDRNHPKIRSLANYCFDLRFSKPRAEQIKGAMLSVCFKESLKIKPDILMDVIVNTNQDIRLILNHLSMLAVSSNDKMKSSTKDIKIGPWDVLRSVFSEQDHKTMSIHDKLDLFFNDYSIAPLFVQENYLMVVPHSPTSKSKLGKMELFAKAAESIANGDLVDRAIRSSNAWSLLPTQAMFSSLIPGEHLEGHMGGQINFPLWLGKNSKKNKMDRLAQEIQSHTRLKLSGSKEDIGLDYCKTLFDAIVKPLSTDGSEGVESALEIMREYSLLREDLDSLSQLSDWNFRPDPFSKLESKVKAAFTRAYNKCPIMSPFAQVPTVKKKSKRGDDEGWGGDEDEDNASDESENDDITNDTMIVLKKKTAKEKDTASSSKASSSASSKRGGRGGKRGRK